MNEIDEDIKNFKWNLYALIAFCMSFGFFVGIGVCLIVLGAKMSMTILLGLSFTYLMSQYYLLRLYKK